AEGIAAGHEQAPRRPAQRRGVTGLEARTATGQLVNVWRLVFVGAVTAHAIDPEVVGKNKDDVGLALRGPDGGAEHAQQGDNNEGESHNGSGFCLRFFLPPVLTFTIGASPDSWALRSSSTAWSFWRAAFTSGSELSGATGSSLKGASVRSS